jgi:hypothetical protein
MEQHEEYEGEMDLSDGNRVRFVLTLAQNGRSVTECGFMRPPTEENVDEFEKGIQAILEHLSGCGMRIGRIVTGENPEVARQVSETFLRGVSGN